MTGLTFILKSTDAAIFRSARVPPAIAERSPSSCVDSERAWVCEIAYWSRMVLCAVVPDCLKSAFS